MKIFNDYFKLREKIYKHFGYQEGWKVPPLMDCRSDFWAIHNEKLYVNCHGEDDFTNEERLSGGYSIFPKGIYEKDTFTLIYYDTQTDGNDFLGIYDNNKKREIPEDVKEWL